MNIPEYIADGAWETVRRVIGTVFRLLIDTGGQSVGIRFGAETVSTTAAVSGTATVDHGLGKTPVIVLTTANSSGVTSTNVQSLTSTDFVLNTTYVDGVARTAGVVCYWLALG